MHHFITTNETCKFYHPKMCFMLHKHVYNISRKEVNLLCRFVLAKWLLCIYIKVLLLTLEVYMMGKYPSFLSCIRKMELCKSYVSILSSYEFLKKEDKTGVGGSIWPNPLRPFYNLAITQSVWSTYLLPLVVLNSVPCKQFNCLDIHCLLMYYHMIQLLRFLTLTFMAISGGSPLNVMIGFGFDII